VSPSRLLLTFLLFIASVTRGSAHATSQDVFIVANDVISVFPDHARGDRAPARFFSEDAAAPAIALDAFGNIYEPKGNAIYVYAQWGTEALPLRIIQGSYTTLKRPFGVAVDSDGYLYVTDPASLQIDVFSPGASGNVAPVRAIFGVATQLTKAMRYVSVSQEFIVVELGGVRDHESPGLTPIRAFIKTASGNTGSDPYATYPYNAMPTNVFVAQSLLFVCDYVRGNSGLTGYVGIYEFPFGKLLQVLTFKNSYVWAAAQDRRGNLHVLLGLQHAEEEVFASTPSQSVPFNPIPEWTLGGPRTHFDGSSPENLVLTP
jgi:hypothetical protein